MRLPGRTPSSVRISSKAIPRRNGTSSGAGDPDIQGFATDISVDQGQTVSFKIKSTTAYGLDIYRMGYYDGLGARRVATLTSSVDHRAVPACMLERYDYRAD